MWKRTPRPLRERDEAVLRTCEEEIRHVRRRLEEDGADDRYQLRLFHVELALSDLKMGRVRDAEDVFRDAYGSLK